MKTKILVDGQVKEIELFRQKECNSTKSSCQFAYEAQCLGNCRCSLFNDACLGISNYPILARCPECLAAEEAYKTFVQALVDQYSMNDTHCGGCHWSGDEKCETEEYQDPAMKPFCTLLEEPEERVFDEAAKDYLVLDWCRENQYENAMKRVSELMGAEKGSIEGAELDWLTDEIVKYEAKWHPVDKPTPKEAAEFRKEMEE